mmetsp:Transcript_24012/g.38588  ORF Transcript_24012/g.38588 Transcript_24012/m.38588 type:complete len:112 (-) Transcript_24012:550-885(-)
MICREEGENGTEDENNDEVEAPDCNIGCTGNIPPILKLFMAAEIGEVDPGAPALPGLLTGEGTPTATPRRGNGAGAYVTGFRLLALLMCCAISPTALVSCSSVPWILTVFP